MTPDVWTQLQIVNCTKSDLCSGSGGSNQGFFNQYQMYSWFNFPAAPDPLVPQGKATSYLLQFMKGASDEDDGADLQINLTDANTGNCNVVWLKAVSTDTSAHYFEALVQTPDVGGQGPFIVAFTETGQWPSDSTSLFWGAPGQTVQLGAPNADQSFAIIDLGLFFPPALCAIYVGNITANSLAPYDAWVIWNEVSQYMGL